jgi:hypothetical protein
VPGLIDGQLRSVRQADRREKTPALIGDLPCHLGSLGLQLGQGGLDVVAHEVELLMTRTRAVSGMNRKLGRGQGENGPAPARVHRRHPEDVREERTDLLGFW